MTAKEWLEKEGIYRSVAQGIDIGIIVERAIINSELMDRYADYRTKMLEGKILYFYTQLATIAKGEYYEGILEDVKNQYVNYFNIEIHRQGKINMEEKTLENKVFEALGEVSMCWSETPKGVFDSVKANEIGDRLVEEIYKQGNTFVVDTKLIPENMNVEEFLKTFRNQPIQLFYPKPSLQEAVEVLCNTLREDKDYFRSWRDNISMAFQDEIVDHPAHFADEYNFKEIADNAAKNFLNLLINK